MGNWGNYPKDSDGALDLFGDINDLVNKNFEELANGYSGYEYAGAIMLLLQKGFHIKRKYVINAKNYIQNEINDNLIGKNKWSKKDIDDIKIVHLAFEHLLFENKKRNEILAPVRWLERHGDRIKDNWSGLGYV